MNRTATIALALAGLALGTGVVLWLGAGHIFHALLKIGWVGLGQVIAWQLAVYVLLGMAWWILTPGVRPWILIWGRLVREGGETTLPFSEIGGVVFGARALMLRGVGFALAAASSIVDVVAEGIALVPFLVFGLVVLLARSPGSRVALPLGLGIGALIVGGGVVYLLRERVARVFRSATERLLKHWVEKAPQRSEELQKTLGDLFQDRRRLTASSGVHVICWCAGGGNVWIAYHLLGAHPSLLDALAIESILSGVLAIGFLVPSGLGVQELSYVGVGRLFGLPAELSLALSLIRRARDILIGAPALLLWQALEARELRRQ